MQSKEMFLELILTYNSRIRLLLAFSRSVISNTVILTLVRPIYGSNLTLSPLTNVLLGGNFLTRLRQSLCTRWY